MLVARLTVECHKFLNRLFFFTNVQAMSLCLRTSTEFSVPCWQNINRALKQTTTTTETGTSPNKGLMSRDRFLKEGINYTRYNSYSRDKSAILGITIRGIKMGSRKHYLSLE